MTLQHFNKQYKYKTDKQKFGFIEVWDIPKLQDDGFYYGDCEDYAIFLKHNISQFENWDYYYCKLNGIGHCVLIYKGKVIDCNIQKVVSLYYYESIYNITELKKYSCLTILFKILFSIVYVPLNKLIKRT